MKKTLLLLSALIPTALPIAQATTVTFSPNPTARTVVSSSGSTVGTTSLVFTGNFANEGSVVFNPAISIADNVSSITTAGGWERFGVDTSTDAPNSGVSLPGLTITATGKVGNSLTDTNTGATKADFFNNKNLYLWLFNATTVGAATQMGIFRSTDATVPWVFPVNGGVGDSVTLSTQISGAPTMVAIGGAGTVQPAGGSFGNGALQLAASTVPEPSVLVLGGIAGMGLLAARRRTRRS